MPGTRLSNGEPLGADAKLVPRASRRLDLAAFDPPGAAGAADATALVRAAYEAHRASVYGFLVSATRDGELAEELLHEAFIRLLKVSRAGEPPLDVRAWLFRVSGNLAVSAARRRQTIRRFAPWLVRHDTRPSPELEYLHREAADRVRGELAHLRADDRVALLMAANGCSTSEIAHALRRGEVAARSVLCRARMRLRERIEAQEVDR